MLNYISPRGRLGRIPYALATLIILGLLVATAAIPALGWVQPGPNVMRWIPRPGLIPAVLLLWPLACVQLGRLRDTGASILWAALPVAVIAAALAFVQLQDGLGIILAGYLRGADSLRRSMFWAFPGSHLALAWAALVLLGGIGWLSIAPGRKT